MGGNQSTESAAEGERLYDELVTSQGWKTSTASELTLNLSHPVDFETYLLWLSNTPEALLAILRKREKGATVLTARPLRLEIPIMFDQLPDALRLLPRVRGLKAAFHLLKSVDVPRTWADHLTVLDLRGNFLTAFPATVARLPHLEFLDLSENSLHGALELETDLPSLRKLNLAGNDLVSVGPAFAAGLPGLERLNVSNNQLVSLPIELGLLPLQVAVAVINRLTQPPQDAANQGSAALIAWLKKAAAEARNLVPVKKKRATSSTASGAGAGEEGEEGEEGAHPGLAMKGLSPLRNAVLGCVLGGALGDAVGLLTEFMTTDESRFHYQPPLSFEDCLRDRHRCKWESGDYTDDTDQLICILQSVLANKGRVDERDFARRLLDWSNHGFPELGDQSGWGLGATIGQVVRDPEFLQNPEKAAKRVWESSRSAANGAVMRTSILGVVDFRDLEAVARNTRTIARTTHYEAACVASTLVVTSFVARVLQHIEQDEHHRISQERGLQLLEEAVSSGRQELAGYADAGAKQAEFDRHVQAPTMASLNLGGPQHIGYTYKCVGSGVVGVRSGRGFEEVITELTLEGGDSDTNGAVCGAMVGVLVGYQGLPARWLRGLVNREWLERQVLELCDLMAIP